MRDIKHLFGSVVADPQEEPKKKNPSIATNVRYEFYSTLRKKIFWRDARGVTAVESPNTVPGPEAFYITIEYELQASVDLDTRELVTGLNLPDNSPLRKELLQQITALNSSVSWNNNRRLKHTVAITVEDIDRAGGVVYLRDFDLIVGYEHLRDQALHPYSQEGQIARMQQQLNFNEQGVNLRFVLIDNTGQVDPVWFNNGVTVIEIRPMRDCHLADGLYVFYQYAAGEEIQNEYLALSDAKAKYHLFDTRIEAVNLGKLDKILERLKQEYESQNLIDKQKITELDNEIRREKMEFDRAKQKFAVEQDEEQAKRKQRQAELDAKERRAQEDHAMQMHALKMERERMEFERVQWTERERFQQDMRSRQQKDKNETLRTTMEILKIAVGFIGPVVSAYLLYKGASRK